MLRRIYDRFEESISLFFFLLIFVLMSVGVINRYLFKYSFPWNIELCRYSFVWLTFVGAAYVRKIDQHIKIDMLFNWISVRLSVRSRKFIWWFKEILTLSFFIMLIYLGWIIATKTWRFRSQAMHMPQSFLYVSVSVGACLYTIREILESFRSYRDSFSQPLSGNEIKGIKR